MTDMQWQIIRMAQRNHDAAQQHYDREACRWRWSADRLDGAFEAPEDDARTIYAELRRSARPSSMASMPRLCRIGGPT